MLHQSVLWVSLDLQAMRNRVYLLVGRAMLLHYTLNKHVFYGNTKCPIVSFNTNNSHFLNVDTIQEIINNSTIQMIILNCLEEVTDSLIFTQ